MRTKNLLAPACLALFAVACGASNGASTSSSSDLHELGEADVLADVEQLGDALRSLYGPLEYKKATYGFDLDQELERARATVRAATNEGERLYALYHLTGQLRDLHVSLRQAIPSDGAVQSTLPFTVFPMADGSYVVITSTEPKIAYGDVLRSIDGSSIADLEASLVTFADYAVPTSSRGRWATFLTSRPSWMPSPLKPRGPTTTVGVTHADGTDADVTVSWGRSQNVSQMVADLLHTTDAPATPRAKAPLMMSPEALASQVEDARLAPRAAAPTGPFPSAPFYFNPTTSAKFGFVGVTPSVVSPTADGLGAVKYAHNGKTLLLVRIPTYLPPDEEANLDWMSTLLADAQKGDPNDPDVAKRPAAAIILDETRNGGGAADYAAGIASMFVDQPVPATIFQYHADRAWLAEDSYALYDPSMTPLASKFWTDRVKEVETAIDTGQWLTPPSRSSWIDYGTNIPVGDEVYGTTLAPHPRGTWKGPVLVLTDERSVSAADMFPQVMQNGGMAKTFGTRTAGGGGNVETCATLTSSGITLSCTRGFFGVIPPAGGAPWLIENNGVKPDYPHPLTVTDVRNQYVDYVQHFSDVASTLTR